MKSIEEKRRKRRGNDRWTGEKNHGLDQKNLIRRALKEDEKHRNKRRKKKKNGKKVHDDQPMMTG